MATRSISNNYPLLNIEALSACAERWARYYQFIQRITIQRTYCVSEDIQYVIIFETPEIDDSDRDLAPYFHDFQMQVADPFDESCFLRDLKTVYSDGQEHAVADEWYFDRIDIGEQWSAEVDENTKIILYEKLDPLDLLLKSIRPQADEIYLGIKEHAGIGLKAGGEPQIKEKRKEAALDIYRKDKSRFPDVRESFLSELDLYDFGDKPHEEFIGTLLMKIVTTRGFSEAKNKRDLFKRSKKWKPGSVPKK
ncbi:MAG: hypothetical protein PHP23_02060 [Desulfobacterales bacterium]|nr:hypothetical protein [Desulfobacterales bacterium]MDD4070838.1 hypothetical protein [Desulfobacterales bacterium]MDD4391240.1 hypothetical protein [Desulfobacterales bacterium]